MSEQAAMRVKEMGATINLGNYSSLHVTVGETTEYAGLDIARATKYLKTVAAAVDGVLNLPEELNVAKKTKKKVAKKDEETASTVIPGQKMYSFSSHVPIWYDHATHTYRDETGVVYDSVTQALSAFYPFNPDGKIKQEYMDFAASFGNFIHTAIQNAVIGFPPKKVLVARVVEDVLNQMGDYKQAFVEQLIALPEHQLAGRFDILTVDEEGKTTLWDVKTNSDLTLSNEKENKLPKSLAEKYSEYWDVNTVFGEHCLQLNLYAYMIEKTTDMKIDKMKIIHVPDKFNHIYEVPKVDVSPLLSAYGAIR